MWASFGSASWTESNWFQKWSRPFSGDGFWWDTGTSKLCLFYSAPWAWQRGNSLCSVVMAGCCLSDDTSCLCSLLEIFWSTSRPNHHRRYCWGTCLEGGELGVLGMETVFNIHSILRFHLCSQGISRMTCCHPRLRTIRSVVSLESENRMLVWAFHIMVSLMLAIPSTLYAQMGLGRCFKGKLALDRRPISMKFQWHHSQWGQRFDDLSSGS